MTVFVIFIFSIFFFIYGIEFINLQFELLSFSYRYFNAILKGERPPKYRKIGWFVALVKQSKPREIDLLNKYCPYYASLDHELKKRFEKRLIRFKYEKDFYYTKDSVKNRELMIMLLSAYAVQLTFGFRKFRLRYFNSIHIHKESFALEGYEWIRLSGFTAGSIGYIAFSETAFLKSIEYPEDGFNVALHEFAHAIDLCGKLNERYLDRYILLRWKDHAYEEWSKLQNCKHSMLPEYASKDVDEFYACAVERFFEQPEQLMKLMPQTFYLLSDLLQQNPLNRTQPVTI